MTKKERKEHLYRECTRTNGLMERSNKYDKYFNKYFKHHGTESLCTHMLIAITSLCLSTIILGYFIDSMELIIIGLVVEVCFVLADAPVIKSVRHTLSELHKAVSLNTNYIINENKELVLTDFYCDKYCDLFKVIGVTSIKEYDNYYEVIVSGYWEVDGIDEITKDEHFNISKLFEQPDLNKLINYLNKYREE